MTTLSLQTQMFQRHLKNKKGLLQTATQLPGKADANRTAELPPFLKKACFTGGVRGWFFTLLFQISYDVVFIKIKRDGESKSTPYLTKLAG